MRFRAPVPAKGVGRAKKPKTECSIISFLMHFINGSSAIEVKIKYLYKMSSRLRVLAAKNPDSVQLLFNLWIKRKDTFHLFHQ